jgi:hypothetical protein
MASYRGPVSPGVVTLVDRSRCGNNGVMTDVTWSMLPSGLWAMSFNGASSKVVIPTSPSLLFKDFTALLWVKPNSFSTQSLIDKDNFLGDNSGLSLYWYQATTWRFRADVQYVGAGYRDNVSQIALSTGTWYHVAAVWRDAVSLITYVNGANRYSVVPTASLLNYNGETHLGHYRQGNTQWFNGYEAIVCMFNYAFSDEQVRTAFSSQRRLFGV